MPVFSARSQALDGVSWVQGGKVENAVGRVVAACYTIRAVVCSLPRASRVISATSLGSTQWTRERTSGEALNTEIDRRRSLAAQVGVGKASKSGVEIAVKLRFSLDYCPSTLLQIGLYLFEGSVCWLLQCNVVYDGF